MAKLEAKNIERYFYHNKYKLKALGGVNLTVNDGDFVCIVGPSGCGKSTFLRIVAGLDKPDSGEILLDGKAVSGTGPERIMVFQEGALTAREKSLIALAVSHAVQCPYCIDAYTSACLEKGSDLEQMTEAVHVATAIRGGASLVHGVQMLDQVKKLVM